MEKSLIKSIAISVPLLISLSFSASAHGPEFHITEGYCKQSNWDNWFTDSGPCDPDNPHDISDGITYEEGDTTTNYPHGLCYPSFNNYLNMVDPYGKGLDPFRSDPAIFKDERNFFKARIDDSTPSWTDYKDILTVKEGDRIQFMMYIHNNGDPCFNDNINIPSGKFYSDWNTTSHDTKVKITPFFSIDGTELIKAIDDSTFFRSHIKSDDAVNEIGDIGETSDVVTINPYNNEELTLKFVKGSAKYADHNHDWQLNIHDISDTNEKAMIENPEGMNLSTLIDNGNIKGTAGDYYACTPYIGVIYFSVDVTKPETPICKEILVDHPEKAFETYLSWFRAQAFDENGNDYDSQITYWVDDQPNGNPYGVFFGFDPGTYPLNPPPQVIETSCVATGPSEEIAPSIINTTLSNVYNSAQQTAVNPSFGISDLDLFNLNFFASVGSQTITVDQCKKVYFYAFADSDPDKVIHVQTTEDVTDILPLIPIGAELENPPASEDLALKDFGQAAVVDATIAPSGVINNSIAPFPKLETISTPAATSTLELAPDGLEIAPLCKKNFPILPVEVPPSVCKDIKVTNLLGIPRLPIIPLAAGQIHAFQAESVDTAGNPITDQIRYAVNPNNGCFSKTLIGASFQGGIPPFCVTTLTVNPGTVVWLNAKNPGQEVVLVDQTNSTVDDCQKWYDIGEDVETPICQTLNMTSVPASPIPLSGANGTLVTINPVDQFGNPLPTSTDTLWDEGGTGADFGTFTAPPAQTIPLSTNPLTLALSDVTATGTITVSLDPTDPAYSDTCVGTIDIVEDQFVCEDISTGISELIPSTTPITEFEPGTWYTLNSDTVFSPSEPVPDEVTYTTNGAGVFLPAALVPTPCNSTAMPDAEAILSNSICGIQAVQGTITVPSGTTVYFITYSDVSKCTDGALEAEATGRSEAACHETFDCNFELDVCKSIVVSFYPIPFNPTATTTISVTPGDYGDFTGMFEFSTAPGTSGKFYLPGQEALGGNPKQFTIAESASGVLFSGGALGDTFTVRAVGELSGTNCNFTVGAQLACVDLEITEPNGTWTEDDFTDNDEQDFEIDVTTSPAGYASNFKYLWEVDNSTAGDWTNTSQTTGLSNTLEDIDTEDLDQVDVWALDSNGTRIDACHDSIEFETEDEEKPKFKKSVFDIIKKSWREIINIGGKKNSNSWLDSDYQYVNYLIEFEPNSVNSAEVTETAFDNGFIKSENLDGKLEYLGMIIAVVDGNDHYIAYQSSGFDEARYKDAKFDGERLTDFDDFDEDQDFYADHYGCDGDDNASGDICLDNDFDDIDEDFSDGKPLKFDKLDNAENIYIIYQLENNTVINDKACQDLVAKIDGCGERFDNQAELRAYRDRDFKNHEEDWDLEDEARVIVICPYVLSRSSGDTFFNDEIDTGIDVSKCYPVSNVPVVVTPKPPTQTITSTGPGDEEIIYDSPTHDVCKLSNNNDMTLPPEYQNVFANFSSSVCELQAEVSEKWMTENIVEAINNNITKIARWGGVDHSVTLTNMSSVERNFSNLQSGVFVVNGNLTIDGGSSGFMINKTSGLLGIGQKLPAAQTYIVRGGTLTINSNIVYNDASGDPKKPSTIPSAAFIVIDGNINISNDVTKIDGILMAVDTDESGDGQIKSAEGKAEFTNTLTVRGSLIGDVRDIFKNRRAIGDPRKDEGSITVRYDERILLNTPSGLNELINISRLKVAK